jgi:hypothetical protein
VRALRAKQTKRDHLGKLRSFLAKKQQKPEVIETTGFRAVFQGVEEGT